jgi:hypothetical protein
MTAGSQPTEAIGAQLPCRIASAIELTVMNTAASAATGYSHRAHDLITSHPPVK